MSARLIHSQTVRRNCSQHKPFLRSVRELSVSLSGSGGNKIMADRAPTERRPPEMAAAGDNLQQIDEFFDRDPRAFNEAAQGSSIKLFMIGDGKMAAIGPVVDHVAAGLVMKKKTDFLKGFGCFPTRDDGKRRH